MNDQPGPSTFEIAKLAALLLPQIPVDDLQDENGQPIATWPDDYLASAAHLAVQLWEAADQARRVRPEAVEQMKALLSGLFTMDSEEWTARLKDFKGDLNVLHATLDELHYRREDVAKRLYRDRSLSLKTRLKLLQGLVSRESRNGHYLAKQERAQLNDGLLSARTTRWLVEARQRQLAVSKSRFIAPSLRKPA